MQTRVDSLMEALTNIAIGSGISLVSWQSIAYAYGLPMPFGENLQITGWFTIISVARQYILRRMFDGKTPWQALKGKLGL